MALEEKAKAFKLLKEEHPEVANLLSTAREIFGLPSFVKVSIGDAVLIEQGEIEL